MRTIVSVDLGRGQGIRMNLKPPESRILHRDLSPRFSLVSHRYSVKGQPSAVLLLTKACRKVEEQTIIVRRRRISRTSRRQLQRWITCESTVKPNSHKFLQERLFIYVHFRYNINSVLIFTLFVELFF